MEGSRGAPLKLSPFLADMPELGVTSVVGAPAPLRGRQVHEGALRNFRLRPTAPPGPWDCGRAVWSAANIMNREQQPEPANEPKLCVKGCGFFA